MRTTGSRWRLATAFIAIALLHCGRDGDQQTTDTGPPPVQVAEYVSGFTSGEVAKDAVIRIELSRQAVDAAKVGERLTESPLSFEPAIAGTAVWQSGRALEFTPATPLQPGAAYTGALALDRLFENVPEELRTFQFRFYVTRRALDIRIGHLEAQPGGDLRRQQLSGAIVSSDREAAQDIEKLLSADQEGVYLNISWNHSDDGRNHRFTATDIERRARASKLRLRWNGASLGLADFQGERTVDIPAADTFNTVSAEVVSEPEPHISILFTDPLRADQNLLGLIHIPGQELQLSVEGNQIKAYPGTRLAGEVALFVEPGIENIVGAKIRAQSRFNLRFEELKPAVRLAGDGVIAPGARGALFPFEAVNLRAVDVRIEKIFEQNIHQFLQVNSLDGGYDLYRVAQEIHAEKIELDPEGALDLKSWNRHVLELSALTAMEPGAIYRVSLAFRPSYSLYACGADAQLEDEGQAFETAQAEDASFWNFYQTYQYYSYRHREDPCHKAYYGPKTVVSRNLLVSNLGLLAKGGDEGETRFFATDLQSARPLRGVQLDIYDFQKELLATLKTGPEGMAATRFEEDAEPFLLIARNGEERGYLQLRDGNALTLSRFDVGGTKIQEGLNGYLYGERGVWRPGDTLHLTFVLRDEEGALPPDHPVLFELIDPRDRVVRRMTATEGKSGFYAFPVETEADWPTGPYQARVKVGGALFQRTIKIETIAPNRLKIKLDLGRELLRASDGPIQADLTTAWLHGAPARNLRADMTARLRATTTRFDTYRDFSFDDPSRGFSSDESEVWQGRVDDNGQAAFSFALPPGDQAPGVLRADFVCKVYEPGGAFSVDRFSAPYHPYSVYVGVRPPPGDKQRGMLLTDQDHPIEIVTVDAEGAPVARQGLDVAVYKLSWRWWWEENADQISSYNARQLTEPIQRGTVNTGDNGEGRFNLRVNYPSWGRYLIRVVDRDGHAGGRIVYVDWPGWAGRQRADQPGGAAVLALTADRESCVVGDTVTLNIPSSEGGRALVSLEDGQRVLDAKWLDTVAGTTRYSFKTTAAMAPTVYASVTLLQPHAQTANDLPIRLYGVVPIAVEDPDTRLRPVIDMPDVLEPEGEFTLRVSERNGRPMVYTVAVVDEGLLDLTRFRTPNPWGHFFAKQALAVRTWDLFDSVLGALAGEIRAPLSVGGDGEAAPTDTPKANRFEPVVRFFGPLELKAGETGEVRVNMPRYVGSVRTMVVAGGDGGYGAADKTTPVRKPLMLLGTLPRVLGPGEETMLPLSVFAMEDSVKQVAVTVEANDLLQLSGPAQQTLTFDAIGDQLASFPLRVAEAVGIGRIKAVAVSGDQRAEFEIELDVRNPNPYLRRSETAVIQPGQTWNHAYQPVGMAGTNEARLELSATPPLNLASRLDYLVRYPHGCIEQTTSAAFPQLFLSSLMELPRATKDQTDANIREGLRRLAGFQLANGGLAYWPGGPQADDWSTNYAGHFALAAQNLGYQPRPGFLDKWRSYQRLRANAWAGQEQREELTQAYRLYLLALAEDPQLGAMNRFRERGARRNVATWLLAAAYRLAGQSEAADQMSRNLDTAVADYTELSYTYGSSQRDRAVILEAMNALGHRGAAAMAERVSRDLNDSRPFATHTVGWQLIALGRYATAGGTGGPNGAYQQGDGEWAALTATKPIAATDLAAEDAAERRLTVRNDGPAPLYATLALRGQPLAGQDEDSAQNLKVAVAYRDLAGNAIDPANLVQGQDFLVETTVYNPGGLGNYRELALSHVFPSGWEIHNERLSAPDGESQTSAFDYRDIRDDRVYTYFDLDSGKNKTFQVKLNASYAGRFYLPAVQAEAMYNHEIHAAKAGRWVVVAPAGDQ